MAMCEWCGAEAGTNSKCPFCKIYEDPAEGISEISKQSLRRYLDSYNESGDSVHVQAFKYMLNKLDVSDVKLGVMGRATYNRVCKFHNINDHPASIKINNIHYGLLQPYNNSKWEEDLPEFTKKFDLILISYAGSFHVPGKTVLIIFKEKVKRNG